MHNMILVLLIASNFPGSGNKFYSNQKAAVLCTLSFPEVVIGLTNGECSDAYKPSNPDSSITNSKYRHGSASTGPGHYLNISCDIQLSECIQFTKRQR